MSNYSPNEYIVRNICNYLLHTLENTSKNYNLSFFLDNICKCYKRTNARNRHQQLSVQSLNDEDIHHALEEGKSLFFLITRNKVKYKDEGGKHGNLKKIKVESNLTEYLLFTIEDVQFHPYSRFLKIVEVDDYQHEELSDEKKLINTVYEALPLKHDVLEIEGRQICRKTDLARDIFLRINDFIKFNRCFSFKDPKTAQIKKLTERMNVIRTTKLDWIIEPEKRRESRDREARRKAEENLKQESERKEEEEKLFQMKVEELERNSSSKVKYRNPDEEISTYLSRNGIAFTRLKQLPRIWHISFKDDAKSLKFEKIKTHILLSHVEYMHAIYEENLKEIIRFSDKLKMTETEISLSSDTLIIERSESSDETSNNVRVEDNLDVMPADQIQKPKSIHERLGRKIEIEDGEIVDILATKVRGIMKKKERKTNKRGVSKTKRDLENKERRERRKLFRKNNVNIQHAKEAKKKQKNIDFETGSQEHQDTENINQLDDDENCLEINLDPRDVLK